MGIAPIPGDTSPPRCGSLPRLQIAFRSMLDEHVLVRIWLCRDRLIVLVRTEQAVPVRKFVVNPDSPKVFGSEVNKVERVNALVSGAYKARVEQSSATSLVRWWAEQTKKRKHFLRRLRRPSGGPWRHHGGLGSVGGGSRDWHGARRRNRAFHRVQ
jgi:hypothetical protein